VPTDGPTVISRVVHRCSLRSTRRGPSSDQSSSIVSVR
jgi:hypothetical protein